MSRSHLLCKLQTIDEQTNRHPLHLQMQHDAHLSFFDNVEPTVVALECCQRKNPQNGSTRLFAVVEKTTLDHGHAHVPSSNSGKDEKQSLDVETDYTNVLLCTNKFLSHYDMSTDDTVVIRPVQIFPLTKVVAAVTSDRALAFVSNTLFSTGLLLSVCQHPVLVRQNDTFLAPYHSLFSHNEAFDMDIFSEIKVVGREPVHQGRLTVNTEIEIFNQISANEHIMPPNLIYDSEANIKEQGPVSDDFYEPLLLSDFALGTKPDIDSNIPTLKVEQPTEKKYAQQPTTSNLEPRMVYCISEMLSILNLEENLCAYDVDNMVGISRRTVSTIGLFDGSLAEIETDLKNRRDAKLHLNRPIDIETNSKQRGTGKRIVKVHVAVGEDVEDGVLYMTPGLSFNVCKKANRQRCSSSFKMIIKVCILACDTLGLAHEHILSLTKSAIHDMGLFE